jgi:spore coat protein U-like protein
MKQVKFNRLAVALAAVMFSGAAWADGTVGVSATIAPECAVTQDAEIAFAQLSMLSGVAASTADSIGNGGMKAICTNGTTSPKFAFTSANSSGSDFRLVGTTDASVFITYSLHSGTGASGSAISYNTATAYPGFTPDGSLQTLPLSGKILATDKQGKKVQAYSDTITVTASFDA